MMRVVRPARFPLRNALRSAVRVTVPCRAWMRRGAMLAASADVYDLPDQDAFAPQHLLRRLLEPEEVAAAITWLCGPTASGVTGAVLPIDGGLTALRAWPR